MKTKMPFELLIAYLLGFIMGLFVMWFYLLDEVRAEVLRAGSVTTENFLITPIHDTWTLGIDEDGQLFINGKSIEKMSDPELKETMRLFREYLIKGQKDNQLVDMMDKQTGYLLNELEKCLERCPIPDVDVGTYKLIPKI